MTAVNWKAMANNAAENAARTAKYVALVSKKRVEILKEQEKIRRLYAKLGKIYYKDYVTDEEPDEAEYKPLCESISVSFRRINRLREQIAAAKEKYNTAAETDEEDDFDFVPVTPNEKSSETAPEEAEEPTET